MGAQGPGVGGSLCSNEATSRTSSSSEDCLSESSTESCGWIQWFCRLEGHEFFCEVDLEYIQDAFNMYGLRGKLDNFDRALDVVTGTEGPDEDDLMESEVMDLYRDATDLYGLVHARYILSPKGLQLMREKYARGRFGVCPRVFCDRQRVLPVGLSDDLRTHRVRVYCPRCQECYDARTSVDGAYFGSSFPAIFLQTYPSCVPLEVPTPYIPKIYGFRVNGKKSTIEYKIERGEYGIKVGENYLKERCALTGEILPDANSTASNPNKASVSAPVRSPVRVPQHNSSDSSAVNNFKKGVGGLQMTPVSGQGVCMN